MKSMATPSIGLEGYARIRAEMDAGTLRDEALARAGLSIDEWTSVQRDWLEKMGADLERGRFELTNRYTQAFLDRQRELVAPSRPAAAPVAATPVAAAQPITAPLPPVAARQEPRPDAPPILPPMMHAPPVVTEMPAPVAQPSARDGTITLTASFDVSALRPALPFDQRSAAPPAVIDPPRAAAAASGVAPAAKAPVGSETQTLPANLVAMIAQGKLPFAASRARAAESPLASTAELPSPPKESLDATVKLSKQLLEGATGALPADLVARIARGALPFARGQAPPGGAAQQPPSASAAASPDPDEAWSEDRVTAPPPLAQPAGPDLPFAAQAAIEPKPAPAQPSSATTTLTLAQYASLCAELAASPQRTDAIFQRYGLLSKGDQLRTDLAWQERLRRNPAEYREWQEQYQRYHAHWIEQVRRGGER